MSVLSRNVRYAIRTLSGSRLSTVMIVLLLGLAIGGTTAVFSFVNAVLLKPLPYRDPGKLVLLWASKRMDARPGISGADLADLKSQNHVFENIAPVLGSAGGTVDFGTGGSETVTEFEVGTEFFSVLGVQPSLGRAFHTGEDQPGANRLAVLSNSFWKGRFGGDRGIIGRKITVDSELYQVIGVMPPGFFFPDQKVQVWLTIPSSIIPSRRENGIVYAIARLKSGVQLAQAQNEVDTIVRRLAVAYPSTDKLLNIGLFSTANVILGDYRAAFWSLLGGMVLLLLIACMNIAHLLLARGMRRSAEISVRMTFGATRGAIFRQLLTESLLLSSAGGVVGIFIAFCGMRVLIGFGLTDIPRFGEAGLDGTALLFALAVSLMTGIAFGLLPTLRVSQTNLNESLKQGGSGRSYGHSHGHMPSLLLVSEVAFAFMLLAGAGLLINSFVRLSTIHWGFRPDHVLVLDARVPPDLDYDVPAEAAFADSVVQRLKALPGAQSVSLSRGSMMGFLLGGAGPVKTVDGKHESGPRFDMVAPGYFQTLGIPLLRGREFRESDGADALRVAVVDTALANELWPGQDPIGKTLTVPAAKKEAWQLYLNFVRSGKRGEARKVLDDPRNEEDLAYKVVGEVAPVLMDGPLPVNSSSVYMDYRQRPLDIPMRGESFFLRTLTEPSSLAAAARDAIRALGGQWKILGVDMLQQRVINATGGHGSNKLLFMVSTIMGSLGLLLAALGIYGVLAYETSLRTHDIGVRLALGAQRGQIFRMVIRRGLMLVVAGLLLGFWGAIQTTKGLASYLFGVEPTDPLTFAAAAFVFLLVAFFACYFPARRAMQLDPMKSLRYE